MFKRIPRLDRSYFFKWNSSLFILENYPCQNRILKSPEKSLSSMESPVLTVKIMYTQQWRDPSLSLQTVLSPWPYRDNLFIFHGRDFFFINWLFSVFTKMNDEIHNELVRKYRIINHMQNTWTQNLRTLSGIIERIEWKQPVRNTLFYCAMADLWRRGQRGDRSFLFFKQIYF